MTPSQGKAITGPPAAVFLTVSRGTGHLNLCPAILKRAQTVKSLPERQETQVRSLGREEPEEKGMGTCSSILAWRVPGQRSLAGCSLWGHEE